MGENTDLLTSAMLAMKLRANPTHLHAVLYPIITQNDVGYLLLQSIFYFYLCHLALLPSFN
jgi:hypothetical protein